MVQRMPVRRPGKPPGRPLPLTRWSAQSDERDDDRRRQPAVRAERRPARGRDLRRRPAAHPRRCGVGEDARAHPSDRVPDGDRADEAERDPGDHVHEQGGGGDAGPGRSARRPPRPRDVGDDVPLRVRPDAPRPRRPPRLYPPVHDLRPGRLAPAREALPRRARRRPEAIHPGGDPQPDLRRQEQAPGRRRLRSDGRLVLRADRRRRLPRVRARAASDERDGLRRPARALRERARAVPGSPRAIHGPVPRRPRRRVPGHEPRPVPLASAARERAAQPDGRRGRRAVSHSRGR